MPRPAHIEVGGLPAWLDSRRLLGDFAWTLATEQDGTITASGELPRAQAADVHERLRKVGVGGRLLTVKLTPPLSRDEVRAARLVDARRRRDTTPGFLRRGTRVDEEGRISLTPEALAMNVAKLVSGARVLDAGCGVGGNAIAFARQGCRVIAVDRDRSRLLLAKHNASVYGVAKNIDFVEADAEEIAATADADVLFVDPPWGSEWNRERTGLEDFPLAAALSAHHRFARLLLKLPPSFDPSGLPGTEATAYFGEAAGDFHRIKFVLISRKP